MNESASEASGAEQAAAPPAEPSPADKAASLAADEQKATDASVTDPDPQDPTLDEVQQMAASARAAGCLNVARVLDLRADELENGPEEPAAPPA